MSRGLEIGVAIVGTTSAESCTSSPVVVRIWSRTAFICLYNGLSAPNDDKLMCSDLCGVNVSSLTSLSVRKDHCDPSSNNTLASVCEPAPTTVAITVFSKQVEFLAGVRVVKDVLLVVFAGG